jgi:hypothetical protein
MGMAKVAGMVEGAIGSVKGVFLALITLKETGMTEAVRTVIDGILFCLVFLGGLDSILLWLFLLSVVVEGWAAVDAIVMAVPPGVVAVTAEEDDCIFLGLVALSSFTSLVVAIDVGGHSSVSTMVPSGVIAVASVIDEGIFLGLVTLGSLIISVDMGGHSSVGTMVPRGIIAVATIVDEGIFLSLVTLGSLIV